MSKDNYRLFCINSNCSLVVTDRPSGQWGCHSVQYILLSQGHACLFRDISCDSYKKEHYVLVHAEEKKNYILQYFITPQLGKATVTSLCERISGRVKRPCIESKHTRNAHLEKNTVFCVSIFFFFVQFFFHSAYWQGFTRQVSSNLKESHENMCT